MPHNTEIGERVDTLANGKARKIYFAECPRCHQPVDLKRIAGEQLAFKAHHDQLCRAACPTAGMRPEEADEWVRDTRAALGLSA